MAVSAALARPVSPENALCLSDNNSFFNICAAFNAATQATEEKRWSLTEGHVVIEPLLEAVTEFLSIFDAFGSQFVTQLVAQDFRWKTSAIRNAAKRLNSESVFDLVQKERQSPPGFFDSSGIDGLLWAKRVLQFVDKLVLLLLKDKQMELKDAALVSYRETLGYRHSAVTRAMFENALQLVPSRFKFISNLSLTDKPSEEQLNGIENGMREFRISVRPHVEALVNLFDSDATTSDSDDNHS